MTDNNKTIGSQYTDLTTEGHFLVQKKRLKEHEG